MLHTHIPRYKAQLTPTKPHHLKKQTKHQPCPHNVYHKHFTHKPDFLSLAKDKYVHQYAYAICRAAWRKPRKSQIPQI